MKQFYLCLASFVLLFISCNPENESKNDSGTWRIKGGDAKGTQYSSLDQITKSNVDGLQLAWRYNSGDADTAKNRSQIQCNPIIVDGVLYGTSPTLKAFALDAATGQQRWKFDSVDKAEGGLGVNRGVTYWEEGQDKRILYSF